MIHKYLNVFTNFIIENAVKMNYNIIKQGLMIKAVSVQIKNLGSAP